MASNSIKRCFTIFEILSEYRDGLSLGEIAARADIPKSATHRMLNALCETAFVTQLPSRDYRLTLRLPGLGLTFLSNTKIVEECQFVLDRLAADVGELVRLSMVSKDTLIWVAKAQGARSRLVVDPVSGHDVVLHATATGKIWLASLTTEQALRHVLRDGFGTPEKHGPAVIQTIEALQAELAATRERGYGLAIEEADPGIVAIAVGVHSAKCRDTVVATLSIAGPHSRLPKEKLEEYLPRLREAAEQLRGVDALMSFADAAVSAT